MEEKQFDPKSIIGYVLIFAIAAYYIYTNKPTPEELEAEKQKQEQVAKSKEVATNTNTASAEVSLPKAVDSLGKAAAYQKLGAFGYSQTLTAANGGETLLQNEVLSLKINNKGGYISEAKLKNFKTYDSIPVYLIKDGKNASLSINFNTSDNRVLNTKDLFFEPELKTVGQNQQLSMRLKISKDKFLEYVYVLKPNEYMLDFSVRSQGLEGVFDANKSINLNWELEALRHAKSNTYENRYTEVVFEYEDGRDDYVGQGEFKEEEAEDVTYVAFKQHFFSSILLTDKAFKKGNFTSANLIKDEAIDTVKLKKFTAQMPLALNAGNLNYQMNWYYGPTDYKILKNYDRNLDEIVPLGWGIFGWINKIIFIPLFNLLSGFLPYGLAIIFMTILVKLGLSPVTYKSYVSQARMKVLKPEITELNEKFADNPMKKQQETMKLYSKAGVSPMSGCIPALLQMPILYALFSFFPSAIALRQKSFLWADDLSSYDTIFNLPFRIPFYGDHVSLFPILAGIATFFYMQMTTGQNMPTQTQPGMPNMKFIMYLSPLFMLFFFNNYASGLSLYYFVSNLITIGIMLVIKNYIIDEDKIHAQIQENKKKPKKQSKFKQRLQEAMEQAEKQQKNRK
ncbi:membrane protein insertase YidC [Aquimarina agarivorans]|uniref:membrane protein insertase YidC n=1 Tax=Aquimarina agarivorans TaxID=980584 RepID=UPI000248ED85|nr:membrane protein insertase YidC [Aquimarina agarivorans]